MKRLLAVLGSPRTGRVLLALNMIVSAAVVIAFRVPHGNDMHTYLALADSILHGKYALWWQLPVHLPDTFRNPGYPLFLAAFRAFTTDLTPILIVQVLLYPLTLWCVWRTMTALGAGTLARNLFLLLLLPSINVLYYQTSITAEPLTMFLISWAVMLEVRRPETAVRAVAMALLVGAAFQCRSALLLFPAAWIAARWVVDRRSIKWGPALLFGGVFVLTTLPYAFWNLRHHGAFSPGPLEGGAGVMHAGWWSGKTPGHHETWYWGNTVTEELVPMVPRADVPRYVEAYEREWAAIDSALRPLLTAADTVMLEAHAKQNKLFRTFNTEYTLARERALKEAVLRHMMEEPGYTIKHKAYSAVRLWVTGINMERFRAATPLGMVAELYPFLLTLGIFLLGVTLVPWALWTDRDLWRRSLPLLIWLVYFGLIHLPVVIQARYTIPVRFLLLAMIALGAERLLRRRGLVAGGGQAPPPTG